MSVGKDPTRKKGSVGARQTNDPVEGNFGGIDYLMRMFRYASTAMWVLTLAAHHPCSAVTVVHVL